jgi:hypothetical protein
VSRLRLLAPKPGEALISSAGIRDESGPSPWHVALLTETEPGRRNRRTIDAVFLVWAALVIGLSAAIASSAPTNDRDVAEALTTVFGWAGALWRTTFFGLIVLAVVILVDVPLRRRWDLARDVLVAVVGVIGIAILLGQAVESDWSSFGSATGTSTWNRWKKRQRNSGGRSRQGWSTIRRS